VLGEQQIHIICGASTHRPDSFEHAIYFANEEPGFSPILMPKRRVPIDSEMFVKPLLFDHAAVARKLRSGENMIENLQIQLMLHYILQLIYRTILI
jgi:hypothetical protein